MLGLKNQEVYRKVFNSFDTEILCYIDNYRKESHRFYHNWNHIKDMVFLADEYNTLTEDLLLAILFHDIIYDPKKTDNEEQSAELFKKFFPEKTDVYNAILETKTHIATTDLSYQLNQLDLKILSSGLNNFMYFEDKIFKEYKFVDYKIYKEKRIEILEKINARSSFIEYVKTRKPKIAIYVGSFNPFHKGHFNILEKAEQIFDKVIIARGVNPEKNNEYVKLPDSLQYRQIETYSGLLTDFIDSLGYDVTLIRGLRNVDDFKYEQTQYRFLKDLKPDLKIVNIFSDIEYEHISSSAIRILSKYGKETKYLL